MFISYFKSCRAAHRTVASLLLIITNCIATVAAAQTPLTWQRLKDEAALKKPVTLEAKRLPLAGLLAQAGEQSGVTLSLAPDSPLSQKLVTLRVAQMNLHDFMGAIARTYYAFWSKNGPNEFTLSPRPANVVEAGISRMGLLSYYRFRDDFLFQDAGKIPHPNPLLQERAELFQQIVSTAGEQKLWSEKGVAVRSLPPEIVDAIKSHYRQANALYLLLRHSRYQSLSGDTVVRLTFEREPNDVADPVLLLGKDMADPYHDKKITVEVLAPDKKWVLPQPLLWSLSKWEIKRRLEEKQKEKRAVQK